MRKVPSLFAALLLVGCVRLASPPPEQWFALGDLRAPLRDYPAAGASPCETDPMAMVADLEQMNALLFEFLQRTAPAQLATDRNGLLLVLAQRELPDALDRYSILASTVGGCGHPPGYRADTTSARALELVAQSRTRLEEAPRLLTAAKQQRAAEAWRVSEARARESERATWCPPDAKTADVFYAWESPVGAIEWYFCDGARVVSEAGETWHVPAPPEVHTRATPAPAGYLKAAKKYPASEIRRPPSEARASSTPP